MGSLVHFPCQVVQLKYIYTYIHASNEFKHFSWLKNMHYISFETIYNKHHPCQWHKYLMIECNEGERNRKIKRGWILPCIILTRFNSNYDEEILKNTKLRLVKLLSFNMTCVNLLTLFRLSFLVALDMWEIVRWL